MFEENSYGIIPLRKVQGEWEALLIQHGAGHWGFPKGHANAHENHLMTAQRELEEETGMTIQHMLSKEPLIETYRFTRQGRSVKKSVTYFLAEVSGNLQIQLEEIQDAKWVPLSYVESYLTFPSARTIGARAIEILRSL